MKTHARRIDFAKFLAASIWLVPVALLAQPEIEIEFIGGFGTGGTDPGQFDTIGGVTVDNAGQIYVTDNDNHRIQICDYQGNCTAEGGSGSTPGQFMFPIGIAIDQDGQIVVSDGRNFRIQIRNGTGVWNTFGTAGDLPGQFKIPGGVAIDEQNQIVIADENNERVQACDHEGNCSVVAFGFVTPRSVGFDSQDRLVISDRSTNRIHLCTPNGPCTFFGSTGSTPGRFRAPTEVWVDAEDRIFITDRDNDRFQVCDLEGACVAFGERGSGPGQFDRPTAIAVDSQNRIIIGDSDNNRIQIFQANYPPTGGTELYTVGGTVSGLVGSGLLLRNNGGDDLPITADGEFTFAATLPDGSSYAVSVFSQPANPEQSCTVTNGSGTVAAADVTDVRVVCSTEDFTVGGTVSGLVGSGLLLRNNGGDDLPITADGEFTFATTLPDGSSYAVSVFSQPANPEQTCTVSNAHGSLAGADVSDVFVNCLLDVQFRINAGLSDAWFNPATNGQGLLITVFPVIRQMFVAWFTYDVERPPDDVTAFLGEPGHRWLTAQGPYSGDTALLSIYETEGGVFDSADPPAANDGVADGTLTIEFADCSEGLVTYELASPNISGEIPIQRIANDNVALCENLAGQ